MTEKLNSDFNFILKSNSKEKIFLYYGNCKVCNDQASGIHYGIQTCEGCKMFFKRSISKNENYVCRADQSCESKYELKKCKLCRWIKCLKAGMSYKFVKTGRKSKIEIKRLIDSNQNQKMRNNLDSIIEYAPIDLSIETAKFFFRNLYAEETKFKAILIYKNILNDHETCPIKAMKKISEINSTIKVKNLSHFLPKELVWKAVLNEFHEFTINLYKYIVNWPGFDKLSDSDLSFIIENKLVMIYTYKVTKMFTEEDVFMIMSYNMIQFSKYWIKKIYGQLSDFIFAYHSCLNSLNLTDNEFALMIPFALTYFDSKTKASEIICQLNLYYSNLLITELKKNNRSNEYFDFLKKVLDMSSYINFSVRSFIITDD